MNYIITAIVFVLIFSVLILVHEFGHFIMAKRAGIKVEEFGFGLPPRIWGKKKGETIYSINAIPFGGFVRMLGEDASDPQMAKNKRSFAAQPMRKRIQVIVAGVVMNFLLAWILLTVGYSFGMQPLLTPEDVLPAISSGTIVLSEGAKIKEVDSGSVAEEVGFKVDDVLQTFNGAAFDEYLFQEILKSPVGTYKVLRGGEELTFEVTEADKLGITFVDGASFPRVEIFEMNQEGAAYKFGLRPGDTIITVNGQQIFDVKQFEEIIRGQNVLEYEVYRNGVREQVLVELAEAAQIIVSRVLPGSPAEKVGFKDGDVIVSINGKKMVKSEEVITFVKEHEDETLAYLVDRNGERIFYDVKPEDGRIGVLLSELRNYGGEQEMSVFNTDLFSSVVEIKDEQYVFPVSVGKAFTEMVRLSKLTAQMFGSFVKGLVSSGDVPDSVAGPVGIAQMTHGFVQEGAVAVLRFVAILSLSLAVINILPFPALDGGRLLFIIIELIIGHRVNQKWEAAIHALGYVLILLLILAVTYSDIMRLITR